MENIIYPTSQPSIKQNPETEHSIKQILSRLTLKDKVGQMTQINLDVIGEGKDIYSCELPFRFNREMLETVIIKHKVGSILNTASVTAQSVEQWQMIVHTLQDMAMATNGIPIIYGVDSIHGATYTQDSTLMPQEIAMGATFNRELVRAGAAVCAYETKASNIPWSFSPVIDLGRDSRWSRQWETFGEDVFLVSQMGVEMVKGYQGDHANNIGKDNVAACLKHYMGYGVPTSGRDRTPAIIALNDLREKHFTPYSEAIKAGALSVMVNSGLINGVPVHVDRELLTEWLKEGLNWDGLIVTDWADINNVWQRDKVAHDQKEAIKMAINAGIDMAMVPYDCSFCDLLIELVEQGDVSMKRIDDAVERVLRLKFRLNLFEKPCWSTAEYPDFGSDKFQKISYDAACEAITLLKNNDNILPLRKGSKILVSGPNANSMRTLNGGWSYSWQGNMVNHFMPEGNTILKSMQEKFGSENICYCAGVTYDENGQYWSENEPDIDAAVVAAEDVDYIVLCLGENSYCETPGNLSDLYLSDNQTALALALATTGKPIILILNEGRPRLISKFEHMTSAVAQTYLPGSQGGRALASILCGEVCPSGKLPYTYPKYPNNLSTYDYKPSENMDVIPGAYGYDAVLAFQWAFGDGLSYTNFEYSNLTIDKREFTHEETLNISLDVHNTGDRYGKESVLLYINDLVATITPDIRRLRGFEKIGLEAGESSRVTFSIPARALAFVDRDGQWIAEKGKFTVQAGALSETITLTNTYKWK